MTDKNLLRARYVGYTEGTENHGDEVLMWILKDLLAPEIEVVFEEGDCDIALLGGGTLINQSPWLIDFFSKVLDHAGEGIVLGTGVGDTWFWGDHFKAWGELLGRCRFVGVRGPHSLSLLREHGIEGAECIGDPYLALEPPLSPGPVKKILGVNLGSTNNSLWGDGDEDFFNYIEGLLKRLRDRGWSFVWVSVWSRDLPLLIDMRCRIGEDSGPVYDARFQALETLSAIGGCDVFLGEKLHACAMAAVAGTPFLSLEYQPKVRDFAASIGMERWVVSTAERDLGALLLRIETLRAERENVSRQMIEARSALRERFLEFVRRIKAYYTGSTIPDREEMGP